jgi:hypothetical protein
MGLNSCQASLAVQLCVPRSKLRAGGGSAVRLAANSGLVHGDALEEGVSHIRHHLRMYPIAS